MATVNGTAGNDFIHVSGDGRLPPDGFTEFDTATDDADQILSGGGGRDIIFAGGGDDNIVFGDDLRASDRVNGGLGFDTLEIDGAVSVVFAASSLKSIEEISLPTLATPDGHQSITMNDANVGAGKSLLVYAGQLDATTSFTFDGSAETDGRFQVVAGQGKDHITGGKGDDDFDLSQGGDDTVIGNGGNDTFFFGDALTAHDSVRGSATQGGTVILDGSSYGAGLLFRASTLINISLLEVQGSSAYDFTSNDGNVAAGKTLVVSDSSSSGTASLVFDGSAETDGHFTFFGSGGADHFSGGAQSDTFHLFDPGLSQGGGADTALGLGGDDTFLGLIEGMAIDGGGGFDTVSALTTPGNSVFEFAADTMTRVEKLTIDGGIFHLADANVAAGKTLTVVGNATSFDGSAESDGHFNIVQLSGDAAWIGGELADSFDVSAGQVITVTAGGGNDTIFAGEAFGPDALFDGGAGKDTVTIAGDYSAERFISAASLFNVETLKLSAGFSYFFHSHDNNVGPGQTLTVDASELGPADSAIFIGNVETDGRFILLGGKGVDGLGGGAGNDILNVGRGGDEMGGGGGADRYVYTSIADSTVANPDAIKFVRADHDRIDLSAIDADQTTAGVQNFLFIGNAAFSSTAGELRFQKSGDLTFIKGDVDGDGAADFKIIIAEALSFHSSDFIGVLV